MRLRCLPTSIYAGLSAKVSFQPISNGQNDTGVSTKKETRLVFVSQVPYIIAAILFGIVAAIVTMSWYGRKPSMLLEEPIGLLGHAAIIWK